METQVPTFRTEGLADTLPTREQMLQALSVGVEALLLRAHQHTDMSQGDGLRTNAGIVSSMLESAQRLVCMHEALLPEDSDAGSSPISYLVGERASSPRKGA